MADNHPLPTQSNTKFEDEKIIERPKKKPLKARQDNLQQGNLEKEEGQSIPS